jgi:ribosomal protein L12E/L44/L45/RPP1/RPP2
VHCRKTYQTSSFVMDVALSKMSKQQQQQFLMVARTHVPGPWQEQPQYEPTLAEAAAYLRNKAGNSPFQFLSHYLQGYYSHVGYTFQLAHSAAMQKDLPCFRGRDSNRLLRKLKEWVQTKYGKYAAIPSNLIAVLLNPKQITEGDLEAVRQGVAALSPDEVQQPAAAAAAAAAAAGAAADDDAADDDAAADDAADDETSPKQWVDKDITVTLGERSQGYAWMGFACWSWFYVSG